MISPNLQRQRPSDHELIGLSIVHRHGDRTPISTLSNKEYWRSTLPQTGATSPLRRDGSPFDDVDVEGQVVLNNEGGHHDELYGQLTAKGCDQLQALGSLLRGRLIESSEYTGNPDFLPESLPAQLSSAPCVAEVYSTRYPRTIQSVQWLLCGLWPEDARDGGSSSRISISTGLHPLMVPDHPDRPAEQIILEEEVHATEEWTGGLLEAHALHASLMRSFRSSGLLSELPGEDLDWDHIRECLQCCTEHGIELPGIKEGEVDAAYAFNMRQWLTRYGYPGLGRYAIGGLIERLLAHSLGDNERQSQSRLRVYSAHDSTLVALLANLAIASPGEEWPQFALEWPPYATVLEVETWRCTRAGTTGVRFLLNGAVLPHERAAANGLVPL